MRRALLGRRDMDVFRGAFCCYCFIFHWWATTDSIDYDRISGTCSFGKRKTFTSASTFSCRYFRLTYYLYVVRSKYAVLTLKMNQFVQERRTHDRLYSCCRMNQKTTCYCTADADAIPLTVVLLPFDSSSGACYSLWNQFCCSVTLSTTAQPCLPDSKRKTWSGKGVKVAFGKIKKFIHTSKTIYLRALVSGFTPIQI